MFVRWTCQLERDHCSTSFKHCGRRCDKDGWRQNVFLFYLELCLKYLRHICFQIYPNEFHQDLTMSHLWQQIAWKLSYHWTFQYISLSKGRIVPNNSSLTISSNHGFISWTYADSCVKYSAISDVWLHMTTVSFLPFLENTGGSKSIICRRSWASLSESPLNSLATLDHRVANVLYSSSLSKR